MEDIANDADFFQNRHLTFEAPVTNAAGNNARIDVRTNGNPNYWVEYKWQNTLQDKTRFIEEFVGRDLLNVPSLNQLQWRVKGMKFTQTNVSSYLSSTEGLTALNNLPQARKALLFPNHDPLQGIVANDVTNFLNSNFSNIFK